MTDKALEAALPGETEVDRYIERCKELADDGDGGTYQWWSRLAEILASLQAMQARAEKAEEANNSLMDERTSIIETKRQQIEALTSRADKAEREYEKVLNSYADENQRLSNAAEAAEVRAKDAMGLLDHLIDWVVHDCGAEPPFTSEQDETYEALKGDHHDR